MDSVAWDDMILEYLLQHMLSKGGEEEELQFKWKLFECSIARGKGSYDWRAFRRRLLRVFVAH